MTAATIVAVAAASVAVLALVASVLVLRKVRSHQQLLEREIERGKSAFDEVVAHELAQRADELEHTLARLRADSLSQLADEERRIAEERRRDVAERERDATERLSVQLVAAQTAVEQCLADWSNDVGKLQESLADDLKRVETRQQALMAEADAKIGKDAERLQASVEEQRQLVTRLRAELMRAGQEVMAQANTELEQHAAERRRALHEVAERLRKRERDLQELVEREGNEATQRIQLALGDIERRQVEGLQRIIARETARYTEAATRWAAQRQGGGPGGDYYWTKLTYLGREYVALALTQYHQNRIDETQLAEYLDTKPRNVVGLEEYFARTGA